MMNVFRQIFALCHNKQFPRSADGALPNVILILLENMFLFGPGLILGPRDESDSKIMRLDIGHVGGA